MAKYKLSSMYWKFQIWKGDLTQGYHTAMLKPFNCLNYGPSPLLPKRTKQLAEKAIRSFCKVNGIKSYGIES